jgi:hypothetical protein
VTGVQTCALPIFGFYNVPKDVWKDPYLTGIDRQKTEENRYGWKLAYNRGQLEVNYERETVDISHDDIGARLPDLARNGDIHKITAKYGIELGRGFVIEPRFTYTSAKMDGESNSYKGHKGGVVLRKMDPSYMVELSVDGGSNAYDKIHPIFNDTRKEKTIETMGIVTWLSPFGMEPWAISAGAGYEKTGANIDFYDQDSVLAFMTVGYRFGGTGGHGHHGEHGPHGAHDSAHH